ncbi:MAG: chemotaxis protein CheA, partial [Betaproteobacteria bacterium]
ALGVPAAASPADAPAGARALELRVGPLADPSVADNLVELFKEITKLGRIEPLDAGRDADGVRRFKVVTTSSDNDLIDLFGFHVAREHVQLMPLTQGYGFHEGAPGAPSDAAGADPGYGFFDDAPAAPPAPAAAAAEDPGPASAPEAASREAPAPRAAAPRPDVKAAGSQESSTLRVSVDKVDQLINLVGELVITQAMLAQNSKGLDSAVHQQLSSGLADLERNTRDLQEAVMSIRMIPMSLVFNRFPRMLRDLAGRLGKKVELVQVGEATELDKGLVEKITDPLTHLVRNSCDHGIELPAERLARGKPEHGTIMLIASHQGGSIVIEVRDDGKGLNRGKLLKKARERGLEVSDSMSDAEVCNLIFSPGFSTADEVTDVSGRGVGMDVVKKNITALGGTVEIDSAEGHGMTVRVRLPLTLAIMDGMSVGVGDEVYIVPLNSVVESFQVKPGLIKTIGGSGRLVEVRDEYMPVLDLEALFGVPRFDLGRSPEIMVVVEAEGGRVALLVDELLGQQQVVVKNVESNYRKVDDVSGATIMGDGRVALILDIGALIRRARH